MGWWCKLQDGFMRMWNSLVLWSDHTYPDSWGTWWELFPNNMYVRCHWYHASVKTQWLLRNKQKELSGPDPAMLPMLKRTSFFPRMGISQPRSEFWHCTKDDSSSSAFVFPRLSPWLPPGCPLNPSNSACKSHRSLLSVNRRKTYTGLAISDIPWIQIESPERQNQSGGVAKFLHR